MSAADRAGSTWAMGEPEQQEPSASTSQPAPRNTFIRQIKAAREKSFIDTGTGVIRDGTGSVKDRYDFSVRFAS
jgi:hypothetical protein